MFFLAIKQAVCQGRFPMNANIKKVVESSALRS